MKNSNNSILIKTDRFLLKSLRVKNVKKDYINWIRYENKRFIEYNPPKLNINILKKYVSKKINKKNCIFLGIFTRNKKHIGNLKFEPINFKSKYAVMGILIGDKKWKGKGAGFEVLKSSFNYLYLNYKITKIYLGVEKKNLAAIGLYKKLGFKMLKNNKIYRYSMYLKLKN